VVRDVVPRIVHIDMELRAREQLESARGSGQHRILVRQTDRCCSTVGGPQNIDTTRVVESVRWAT
jgi:hypothetical protein